MIRKHFCNYEHLGGCEGKLTHRAVYWVGEARRKNGKYAHWCAKHARMAGHINGLTLMLRPEQNNPFARG